MLRPKIEGTLLIDSLLAGSNLDFMVLFSSISTAVGSWGLHEYTSANAFLDAFAKSGKSRSSSNVITVGWDSWRDVGFAKLTGTSENHSLLRMAIRSDEGVEALRRIFAHKLKHVYVTRRVLPNVIADAEALVRWMDSAGEPSAASKLAGDRSSQSSRNEFPLVSASDGISNIDVETKLVKIWSELLGIDVVSLDDNFFELGGHSLLATRVIARINEGYGIRIALRDVFDAPTIRQLAERIRSISANAESDMPSSSEGREEMVF